MSVRVTAPAWASRVAGLASPTTITCRPRRATVFPQAWSSGRSNSTVGWSVPPLSLPCGMTRSRPHVRWSVRLNVPQVASRWDDESAACKSLGSRHACACVGHVHSWRRRPERSWLGGMWLLKSCTWTTRSRTVVGTHGTNGLRTTLADDGDSASTGSHSERLGQGPPASIALKTRGVYGGRSPGSGRSWPDEAGSFMISFGEVFAGQRTWSECVCGGAPGESRTHTGRVLNPLPLPVGLRGLGA